MTTSQSITTTDHEAIRRWAEERGGQPAGVKGTGDDNDAGILRIDFPGGADEDSLEPISWDEWFEKFDENGLAAILQERKSDGELSSSGRDPAAWRASEDVHPVPVCVRLPPVP